MKRRLRYLIIIFLIVVSTYSANRVEAISINEFPSTRPNTYVYDRANIINRASRKQIEKKLIQLGENKIDPKLITVRGSDYEFSIDTFSTQVLDKWSDNENLGDLPLLLLIIDADFMDSYVIADERLTNQLPISLLKSTGLSTMSEPLRRNNNYTEATINGINRLNIVINGGEDPGPPEALYLNP